MTDPILLDLPDELVGERVVVRPFRPGDGQALYEAINESREHLAPWLPWADQHQTLEESEARVRQFDAKWRLREDMSVAVCDRETGRFLGGAGLHRIDWKVRRFEIGYWLRHDAVGRGLMTEAAFLLCELAFGPLAANRVIIRCAVENEKSAAIPRRLGFLHEAVLANDGVGPDGTPRDFHQFAMTPDRWRTERLRQSHV